MIYGSPQNSLLLSTGLGLNEIGEILAKAKGNEAKILEELEKKGKKYSERYLTYKTYKELTHAGKLKEAILPILAALPCVGKTTMAREVATAFGIGDVMGGDAFRAALREYISKEQYPAFHTSVYEAWKFFGEENKENILKGFDAQARVVNQAIERIVADRGIRDGESMVFEYLHFLPSHYNPQVLHYPAVIPVVLRLDSEEIHKERVMARDTTTHFKGNASRLIPALERYRMMQDYQCEDARKHNVPVVSTDDWPKAVDAVFEIIFARIKQLNSSRGVEEEPEIVRKLREERKKLQKG